MKKILPFLLCMVCVALFLGRVSNTNPHSPEKDNAYNLQSDSDESTQKELQALVGKKLNIPEAREKGGLYYKVSAEVLRYWFSTPEEHFAYPDTQPEDLIFRVNYTQALIETGVYKDIQLFDYEDKSADSEFMVYKVPKEIFTPLVESFFDGIKIDEDYLVLKGYMDAKKTAYILSGAGGYGGAAEFIITKAERLEDGNIFIQACSEKEIADYPTMQLSFVVDDSGEYLSFITANLEYIDDEGNIVEEIPKPFIVKEKLSENDLFYVNLTKDLYLIGFEKKGELTEQEKGAFFKWLFSTKWYMKERVDWWNKEKQAYEIPLADIKKAIFTHLNEKEFDPEEAFNYANTKEYDSEKQLLILDTIGGYDSTDALEVLDIKYGNNTIIVELGAFDADKFYASTPEYILKEKYVVEYSENTDVLKEFAILSAEVR